MAPNGLINRWIGVGAPVVLADLIIYQQFHGVVPPLDEHQFVGLPGCRVGEGGPQVGPHARLDPQTQGQGEDLMEQGLLQTPMHVVGSHGEADLEGIWTFDVLSARPCE